MKFLLLLLFPILPACNIRMCGHLEMGPEKPCQKQHEEFKLAHREGTDTIDIINMPF